MSANRTSERFQILSLDGGGIKGLFSAAVIAALEEDFDTPIVEHFDLITGTSTGGIVALCLGMGLSGRQIVDFYVEDGPKIFPSWFGIKAIQQWFARKYSAKPLEQALRSRLGEKKFGESTKRLVIPTYNVGEDDVYIFRTPHHERLRRDFSVPAWQVALATGAAPTFFPCVRHVNQLRLIDGGVWANNPTMVGIVEAYGTLGIPLDSIRVLSIGTSEPISYRPSWLNYGGIIAWAFRNVAVEIILRGQSLAAQNQAAFLLGKKNVERVNPKVAAGEFSLHGVHKADDLISKAVHFSRAFGPAFKEKFLEHRAPLYTPLYERSL